MAKVHEVKPGFEKEFDLLADKKAKLSDEKNLAIEKAIEGVNLQFAEREKTINDLLSLITVEVDEPDEEVEHTDDIEPTVEEVVEEPIEEVKTEGPVFNSQVNAQAFSPNQKLGF